MIYQCSPLALTPGVLPVSLLTADVGGTTIKLGIVEDGKLLACRSVPANAHEGLAAALPRMEMAWREMSREAEVDPATWRAIGIAFPGLIHPRTGRILSTPAGKFDDAKTFDLGDWARRRLGLPLCTANDANAALAGEWRYGAARGVQSVVMMTLGTGIGTSVIIDGVPLRGEHGQAGNLGGHFVQSTQGRPCPCGNVGCAEALASGWAVEQLAHADPAFSESALAGETSVDYAAVFRLAECGDALALKLRTHSLAVWGALAVSLVHAYDPERIVLGGGVMHSAAVILPAVQDELNRHAWTPWGKVQAVAATLGNDAGMLGMAHLAEALAKSSNGHDDHRLTTPLPRPHVSARAAR
jgi:glucokinase